MSNYEAMLFGWGAGGAVLVQLLRYYLSLQNNNEFNPFKAILIVFATGLGCLAYFTYIDTKSATYLLIIHYGIFLALTINEAIGLLDSAIAKENEQEIQVAKNNSGIATYLVASTPLFLMGCNTKNNSTMPFLGYLATFGSATLGAIIIEIRSLRRIHNKRKLESTDYMLSFAAILVSSIAVCILHGEVNSFTAIQLGATVPMIKDMPKN